MMNPRRGLARQINRRLLLALVLASIFTAVIGTWVYHESNRRAYETRLAALSTHLSAALAQVERTWGREAYNFKGRLEYTRLLEDRERRQIRLTGYLTSQGGSTIFPYMRVVDRAGREIVSYAYDLGQLPHVDFPDGKDSLWHWDAHSSTLFRVFQQTIWTGEGNGLLQLYKPADHALLNSFDLPGSTIVLIWNGQSIASSHGQEGVDAAIRQTARQSLDPMQWLSWGEKSAHNPDMLILPGDARAFDPSDLAIPLAIAMLVFALAAWATLGRWSMESLQRIQALRYAQEQFAEDRSLDNEIDMALTVARAGHEDEISDVADTLQMMMTTIVTTETAEIEAREAMEHSERRFRVLVEGTRAIAWEYDLVRDCFDYVSPQAQAILGYPLSEWTRHGFFSSLLPPDESAKILEQRRRIFSLGQQGSMEYRVVCRDGSALWLQDLTTPQVDTQGAMTRILGLSIDITERKRNEEKLQLSDVVVRNASEGIMITDGDNRIIDVNPAFEIITGYTADEAIGCDPRLLKSGLQDAQFYQRMWASIHAKGQWSGELWNRRKNGEMYAQRASIVAIQDAPGQVGRHLAIFADITVEKQQEEELAYQAGHDPLTGLINRRLLGDRIESAIARARRDNTQVGFLILDLDGFKHINDTLGHMMGDRVLVEVANRIHHTLRETDTLARIGGDEFMILVEGVAEADDLQGVAHKVLEQVQDVICLDDAELYVTTSIGITVFPSDGLTMGELFANADTALYRAKAEGRNAFRFFTAKMHEAAIARMGLETELRRAIPNHEFALYYQPVVELATGRIAKAEALVRWLHPLRGTIPPNDFIPIAEDSGLILPLGHWIIGEAARQAAFWDAWSTPEFKICVNFSAYQFRRSDPIKLISGALDDHGIGSGHLSIEITESLFMDGENDALAQLQSLRDLGFEIAIDDFGTGYSSLSYLQRLPVDTLKIDRSFVMGIPEDPKSMALIDAMLSLGHTFGISVIAEGIETETQANFLRERGCQFGQGYFFGRPVPAEEFARKHFIAPDAV